MNNDPILPPDAAPTPTPTPTALPDAVLSYFKACGAAGGHARAAKMSKEERVASARLAARAPRRKKAKA